VAAISFASAVALASSIALGGCFGISLPLGEDPCQVATTHVRLCLGVSAAGEEPGAACVAQTRCTSACINAASCDEIKDAFGPTPGPRSSAFLACTTVCAGVAPDG
jgi:hypothetical protein